jgi:uncharacterized protein YndB with AHSA1/START domain
MQNDLLRISTALQIGKPRPEVFEALVNPEKMSNYFISKSSGRMEAGKTLTWEFPEFDQAFEVQVDKIETGEHIAFLWEGADACELMVEISLETRNTDSTLVTIVEHSMPNNDIGIAWLKNNTAGWANFLACLKAYLEFGINLRKGGYDYLIKS